ncbi:hypothetical protein AGMMS50212_09590 [Spirochaetia bacterium]|nr:hypothetical protein AGMMS50212_09590 [Spirochaetia bacterium]
MTKFDNFEIDSLAELNDEQFYTHSDLNLDLNKNRTKIQKGFTEHGINYDLKAVEYFIDFENVFIISKKPMTSKKISKKNRRTN